MDCKFVVGQKVVCINDAWCGVTVVPIQYPKKNEKYIIRDVFISKTSFGEEIPTLYLNEIHNPPCQTNSGFMEQGFDWRGFAPIEEKPTSIAVFQQILNNIPQKIPQKELTS